MKIITTTNGFQVQVDDKDYPELSQYRWEARKDRHTYYAYRRIRTGKKRIQVSMHRVLMNTPAHLQVDHRDRNGLNNQRDNLRNVNRSVNCHNVAARSNTGYLGVTWDSYRRKDGSIRVGYKASVGFNGMKIHIGRFDSLELALIAREHRVRELYGENANV